MDMTIPTVIYGNHDQKTIDQLNRCAIPAYTHKAVLCADGHFGYSCPIGGVVAYFDQVAISGVGFDIACGVKGAKLNLLGSDLKPKDWKKLASDMAANLFFGVGSTNKDQFDHELFEDDPAWDIKDINRWKQVAREQAGSCGSGNHYACLLVDEDDYVWIATHFGSRGLGNKIATDYLKRAGGKDGMDVPPTLVSVTSDLGKDYLAGMHLAGRYAYACRDWVVERIRRMIAAPIIDQVHNHHNFAWKETHDGYEVWVVRKGATPAFPGQRGFVGGSMGTRSAVVHGIESEKSRDSLYSTVHGAGRTMSRREAAGKVKWLRDEESGKKRPTRVEEGKVNESSMRQKIANQGIELRGGGADEAPDVYRKLEDVLDHHVGTIEVETWLTPKVVVMAGKDR